jgi:hypothetical protein
VLRTHMRIGWPAFHFVELPDPCMVL